MLTSAAINHGGSLKDNNMHGFLRRAGKKGKSFALRRKRWYILDGAIFSKHMSEVGLVATPLILMKGNGLSFRSQANSLFLFMCDSLQRI